ncbi:hypothetical protein NBRC116585_15920 [Thalassolituus maritimus]|uniref:Uncharacterized protein n=1 Tax=Thalassolituus maritimus TaxID=484498 RepID=A0ABP9ZZE3_9GAMM
MAEELLSSLLQAASANGMDTTSADRTSVELKAITLRKKDGTSENLLTRASINKK